ncbi:hypothetical protein K501DRAFT_267374 [Backusella circina FSU 941]|nr:hypothetical protein K501DRAFT_267374 [Backusella circina FSU 941]
MSFHSFYFFFSQLQKVSKKVQVDINHGDNDGWTSLHYAAALGLWRSLEFLTSLPHCNLNARTNDGLEAKDCSKTDSERKLYTLIINRTLRRIKAKSCVVNKRNKHHLEDDGHVFTL